MIKTWIDHYSKMIFFILLLVLGAVMAGEEKTALDILRDANSQFSAKMFSEVARENPGKSIVLSAFSALTPLALLGFASVGESREEIVKLIGLPNDSVTKEVFPVINKQLQSAKAVQLKTANKIYVERGYQLNDDFAATAKDIFDSEVETADFLKKQETAQDINNWVEQQTNHRIKNLVSPDFFDEDTRAVLVNAIYFKGNWLQKFDKTFTVDRDFHVTNEKTIKLPTMFKTSDFLYGESTELDAKVLNMPYEGYEASLYIFLPNQIGGITALKEKLKDPSAASRAIQNMFKTRVDVAIPKFKIETTINLKNVLIKMGAGKIFESSKAKIDKLLKNVNDLYVSEAIQKAVIEINEEGAEAAASNAVITTYRAAKAVRTYPFIADRPFYFVLKYGTTDLFSGVFAL